MFDLQEGLGRDHISSIHPLYQSKAGCATTRTTDFTFCNDGRGKNYENCDEEDYSAHSPRLWSRNTGNTEAPVWLSYNHCYTYPSPASRFQAMVEGRREIMEMIQNIPESSYELSLKDIVDDRKSCEGVVRENVVHEERVLKPKTEPKAKRKKNPNRGQISRSESMESGVFLLKMFFPDFLCSKRSSVSRRSSFDGSTKLVVTEWWKISFSLKNKNSSSSSGSTGSMSSTRSRDAGRNFKPCCSSINNRACKPRRQRGCLFF